MEDGGTIRCHRQLPAARKDKETHRLSRSLWKGHSRANAVSLAGWTPFQTSDHKNGKITVLLLCCYKPQSSVSFATAAGNYYRLYMHASSLEWAFYWQEEDIVTRLLPRSLSSLELQKSHLTHQIEVFKYSPMINWIIGKTFVRCSKHAPSLRLNKKHLILYRTIIMLCLFYVPSAFTI